MFENSAIRRLSDIVSTFLTRAIDCEDVIFSVHPIAPHWLNKHSFKRTIIWSESQQHEEQSDDQGLIYTLMLFEGRPLIFLHTTDNHIVVQTSDRWFDQADCFPLS